MCLCEEVLTGDYCGGLFVENLYRLQGYLSHKEVWGRMGG